MNTKVDIGRGRLIVCKQNKYTLVDEDLNALCDKHYSYISPPAPGDALLLVEDHDGEFGWMDIDGNIVIPPVYDSMNMFVNGLCVVVSDGEIGAVNMENELVIPLDYEKYLYGVDNILFLCKDGLWGEVANDGTIPSGCIMTNAEMSGK